jgi:hypothetical protein
MSIDRIFSELNSRQFKFIVDGEAFELPHMNSMKSVIQEAYGMLDENGNIANDRLMIFLFTNAGNLKWATKLKTIKIKEARKIYTAWQEWSGFELGKYLGVLSMVDKYLDAVELDLLEKNINFRIFFEESPRTQINIIYSLGKDRSSNLFTVANDLEYRWGWIPELLTQQLEAFVTANSEEGTKPFEADRPYNTNQQVEVSEETQAQIMEKLTPFNWD